MMRHPKLVFKELKMKKLILIALASLSMASAMASTLQCSGTEPFWGVRVEKGMLMYSDPVSRTRPVKVLSRTEAAGFSEGFAFVIKTKSSSLTVISGECSDGMSDNIYSHHAVYDRGGVILAGCCDIK